MSDERKMRMIQAYYVANMVKKARNEKNISGETFKYTLAANFLSKNRKFI